MHMANIGVALKKLPPRIAGQVKLVFVTTDPARDTPRTLRSWLDNFDQDFIGLTGTQTAIDAVQRPVEPGMGSHTRTLSLRTREIIWCT
jgi:protein SCO1/2